MHSKNSKQGRRYSLGSNALRYAEIAPDSSEFQVSILTRSKGMISGPLLSAVENSQAMVVEINSYSGDPTPDLYGTCSEHLASEVI